MAGSSVTASAAPETPKAGKTNVIPYSQYRKSRLDSIRNDLGLSGVSLPLSGTCFKGITDFRWSFNWRVHSSCNRCMQMYMHTYDFVKHWDSGEGSCLSPNKCAGWK